MAHEYNPPSNRNNDNPLYKYSIEPTSGVPGLDSQESKEIYDKLKDNNMLSVFDLSYEKFLRFLYNDTFNVDKNQNFRNVILGPDNEETQYYECEDLIQLTDARLYLISKFLEVSHAKNIQASVQNIVEGNNNRKFNRMGGSKKKVSKKKVSKKKLKKKVSKKKLKSFK
jgi:hypothetical protein